MGNRMAYSSPPVKNDNTDCSPNLEGMAGPGSDALKGVRGVGMGVGGRSQMM